MSMISGGLPNCQCCNSADLPDNAYGQAYGNTGSKLRAANLKRATAKSKMRSMKSGDPRVQLYSIITAQSV